MNNINTEAERFLIKLGERLKAARLAKNESQELFAQRLGITRQSYSKMEKGSPRTPIGNWLVASSLLGRFKGWEAVLVEPRDLFAQFEANLQRRQRAWRRRNGK
ncbi:MAG: helix-turn-helix transcriptional regulator [Desulfobulbales bacterium]|nr:helix-turn-helix transcriptional regulator [Desulfobulbales bacterium]